MKLDELLQQIGEFGPYQKRVYILAAIPTIFCAAESLSVIFIFFFPEHRYSILFKQDFGYLCFFVSAF